MARIGDKPVGEIMQSSDYINVYCSRCKEKQLEVDLAGMYANIAMLKFTCPSCGDLGTWKLNNSGLGFLHMTKGNR
ncbi:hypothetical protein [Candidatus Binatus sp.]|jgi:phage FluMu protein Com|uniref:hypothetical protein n=1 Tax=Candidatus Binatus sp. TaxID=2811406 RepID=UPI002FD8DF4B